MRLTNRFGKTPALPRGAADPIAYWMQRATDPTRQTGARVLRISARHRFSLAVVPLSPDVVSDTHRLIVARHSPTGVDFLIEHTDDGGASKFACDIKRPRDPLCKEMMISCGNGKMLRTGQGSKPMSTMPAPREWYEEAPADRRVRDDVVAGLAALLLAPPEHDPSHPEGKQAFYALEEMMRRHPLVPSALFRTVAAQHYMSQV